MTTPIALSPTSIGVLTSLLEARTGQELASYRSWRLDTALKPLLKQRDLASLEELVQQLLQGDDPVLADQVVDGLVNGETSFFRDAPVFDTIMEAVTAAAAQHRRVRIWCAGCATGQEALSLAMLFADPTREAGAPMPEIVATDVSESALARARSGRYTQFEAQRGLPIRRLMQWFDGAPDGDWIAKPELLRHIRYTRANLVADPAPPGRFDMILCRNVMLYLSSRTKPALFEKFAAALRPDGLLVMGAGETVIGQTTLFAPSPTRRGLYARARGADSLAA